MNELNYNDLEYIKGILENEKRILQIVKDSEDSLNGTDYILTTNIKKIEIILNKLENMLLNF
jgi:peptidoglycan hydrolase CwlO-like protein